MVGNGYGFKEAEHIESLLLTSMYLTTQLFLNLGMKTCHFVMVQDSRLSTQVLYDSLFSKNIITLEANRMIISPEILRGEPSKSQDRPNTGESPYVLLLC